jgi:hypothetical protein
MALVVVDEKEGKRQLVALRAGVWAGTPGILIVLFCFSGLAEVI